MAFGFMLGLPEADISIRGKRARSLAAATAAGRSPVSATGGRAAPAREDAGRESLFEQPRDGVCAFRPHADERAFTYPRSVTVARFGISPSVFAAAIFPVLRRPVGRGVGTRDHPSERPSDGKSESPTEERC